MCTTRSTHTYMLPSVCVVHQHSIQKKLVQVTWTFFGRFFFSRLMEKKTVSKTLNESKKKKFILCVTHHDLQLELYSN